MKTIILEFVRSLFSIPSKESLKPKTEALPSKIKYLKNCLNSVFTYLEDETLKPQVVFQVNEFLNKVQKDPNFRKKDGEKGTNDT